MGLHWRKKVLTFGVLLLMSLLSGCKGQGVWGKSEQRRFLGVADRVQPVPPGQFHFVFPIGVERQRFAFVALESLRIGSRVRVEPIDPTFYNHPGRQAEPAQGGFVASMGELRVGKKCTIGSVYALGQPASIDSGVRVLGYLKRSGPVEFRARPPWLGTAIIGNAAAEQVFLTPPEHSPTRVRSVFSQANDARPREARPGTYESLRIGAGSTLRVSTGAYVVQELALAKGGILEVDNSLGPVEFWVERQLRLDGSIEDKVVEPTILIAYAGSSPVVLTNAFRATLLAPHATVTVTRTDSPHVGAFFARRLVVADGTRLLQIGFMRWRPLPATLDSVCNECVSEAKLAADDCCMEFNARMGSQQSRRETWSYQYGECLLNVQGVLAQCELQNRYRPGVCVQAGYHDLMNAACSSHAGH